jgi:hypothetical protein
VSIGDLLSMTLIDDQFRSTLNGYMEVPVTGYDRPILRHRHHGAFPAAAALIAQFAANGVDFQTVVGFGQHTDMSPQMHDATNAFIARIFAEPTVS